VRLFSVKMKGLKTKFHSNFELFWSTRFYKIAIQICRQAFSHSTPTVTPTSSRPSRPSKSLPSGSRNRTASARGTSPRPNSESFKPSTLQSCPAHAGSARSCPGFQTRRFWSTGVGFATSRVTTWCEFRIGTFPGNARTSAFRWSDLNRNLRSSTRRGTLNRWSTKLSLKYRSPKSHCSKSGLNRRQF